MRGWQILPGLWQCPMFPDTAARAGEWCEAAGVGTVVGLAPRAENPALRELAAAGAIEYVHWPIPDGKIHGPVANRLLLLAAALARRVGVAVHCRAGRNRSGLLVALIVRERLGLTGRDAMELVRERRPRALANEDFAAWLDRLPAPMALAAHPSVETEATPAQTEMFA